MLLAFWFANHWHSGVHAQVSLLQDCKFNHKFLYKIIIFKFFIRVTSPQCSDRCTVVRGGVLQGNVFFTPTGAHSSLGVFITAAGTNLPVTPPGKNWTKFLWKINDKQIICSKWGMQHLIPWRCSSRLPNSTKCRTWMASQFANSSCITSSSRHHFQKYFIFIF